MSLVNAWILHQWLCKCIWFLQGRNCLSTAHSLLCFSAGFKKLTKRSAHTTTLDDREESPWVTELSLIRLSSLPVNTAAQQIGTKHSLRDWQRAVWRQDTVQRYSYSTAGNLLTLRLPCACETPVLRSLLHSWMFLCNNPVNIPQPIDWQV